MVTFLGILKIIGIVLGCILGFVLFILLLILLVPVRYKLKGHKLDKNDTEEAPVYGKVVISWLLHIFQGEVIYDQGMNLVIRIFGIPLFNKNKRDAKPKKEKKSKGRDSKQEEHDGLDEELLKIAQEEMQPEDDSLRMTEKDSVIDEDNSEDSSVPKKKIPFKERVASVKKAFEDLPNNFDVVRHKIIDKITNIVETIRYYYKLLHTKGATKVFEFLKKEVKKILGHIKPRSVKGFVDYSSDDPATSANICKYYGYMIAIVPRNLRVNVGYGEKSVSFKAKVTGHITLGYMAVQGLKVIFNKRLRILIKKLKREGE